jgi:predicted Zn-dependent peptidase
LTVSRPESRRPLARQPQGRTRPASAAPVANAAAIRTEQRKLEQSHLVLARRTVSATSPDRFAARIFAEIFGGGMASRLFQDVREARGLAYTIDASCDQHSDCGRISVYAGSDPKDAAEVVKITSDIWGDMATAGPTESELARAKAVAAAQFAMSAKPPPPAQDQPPTNFSPSTASSAWKKSLAISEP